MRKKVLIVDDSITARRQLSQYLKDYQVIESSDGLSALASLEENNDVCMIFIDLNMPWMDGLEFIAKIKESNETSSIPICILTGDMGHSSLTKAKKFNVEAFIVKPANKEQVKSVIQSLTES